MNRADEEAAKMLAEEQSARKTLAIDGVATDERSHGATTLIDFGRATIGYWFKRTARLPACSLG